MAAFCTSEHLGSNVDGPLLQHLNRHHPTATATQANNFPRRWGHETEHETTHKQVSVLEPKRHKSGHIEYTPNNEITHILMTHLM